MSAAGLRLNVEEDGATLHIRLAGEFDLAGVGPVENALDRLARAPAPTRVVFDLRALTFLDMAGLHTIIRAHARGLAEAFEVVVVRPRGLANRVFTLTRAGRQLGVINELADGDAPAPHAPASDAPASDGV
jgi:anti-anti-sigma factor